MVRDHDHGNVQSLQPHPKAISWKFKNPLYLGLSFQMQCKVKTNIIEVPTYYNGAYIYIYIYIYI
jgi:hypothetical protein